MLQNQTRMEDMLKDAITATRIQAAVLINFISLGFLTSYKQEVSFVNIRNIEKSGLQISRCFVYNECNC